MATQQSDSEKSNVPQAVSATQPGEQKKREGVVPGFRHFMHNYGIAALALGVVIGNAVNDLVKILVDGLVTPLVSLITPDQKLQTLQFVVGNSTFKVGAIINGVISFLVIAWVVYLIAKLILRNEQALQKK